MPQSSIAPIRQGRLLPPNPDGAWPEDVWDVLPAEVGLGHIGIVFSIEVSRVARNNRDWYHLLDLCALVDALIADADGLYHPGAINDRLLLGLKGTISEFELHLIRSRLNGGLWEAARRGALRTHVPIGYAHDREGRIIKVADEAVRETISLIFSKFAELGSARQVTTYLATEGVLLPHRRVNDDAVSWRRATYELVHGVLTNPTMPASTRTDAPKWSADSMRPVACSAARLSCR